MSSRDKLALALPLLLGLSSPAWGIGVPGIGGITDPNSVLPASTAVPIIKTIGLIGDQRPYEPATGEGTHAGFDLGIEATLMQIPQEFNDALSAAGSGGGAALPFVPMPKINLHKGLGEAFDIGLGLILFSGQRILGADAKIVVWNPEEGPTWAIRLCYSSVKISANQGGNDFTFSTTTWTPQVLVSRQLFFADPYAGVGYEYVTGSIGVHVPSPVPALVPDQNLSVDGTGGSFLGFLGVSLKIPNSGIRLTIEGAYNTIGANTLGTKFGFNF